MGKFSIMHKPPDEPSLSKIENGNGCRHYWKIEIANGPKSKGTCKLCGAEQEFQNSPQK